MRKSLVTTLSAAALLAIASGAVADDPLSVAPDKLFAQLDANGDGRLSGDEIPADKQPLFERLVRIADADSDGKLDGAEFAAGLKGTDDSPPKAKKPKNPENSEKPNKTKKAKKPGKPNKPGRPATAQRPDPARLFQRLDANGDGKVVLDEIPEPRREQFQKLIARADKDGDGALSLQEFSRGTMAQQASLKRPQAGRDPAQLFARMDRNGDGKVTADELPEERRPMIERMIKHGDKDGDGALTSEEFSALVKNRPQQPQPPAGDKSNKKAKKAAKKPGQVDAVSVGLFRALDADRDRQLSSEEINAAPAALRKFDADGDGTVTARELNAAAKTNKKKKKPN